MSFGNALLSEPALRSAVQRGRDRAVLHRDDDDFGLQQDAVAGPGHAHGRQRIGYAAGSPFGHGFEGRASFPFMQASTPGPTCLPCRQPSCSCST